MAKSPTIRLAAAAGQRISVGLNYPWAWNKWGAFFGSGEKVPGDCPDYDRWLSNLDRNLGSIADIVSVVRIFLFGNFCNLGTVKMGVGPPRRRSGVPVTPWYNFVPPRTVSSIYTDQLDRMFAIFNKHQMKVLPVLTDAVGFAQFRDRSGYRTDIITNPQIRDWFPQSVVDPFVAVSASGDNAKAVFAWEVMNEPGHVTDSLHVRFLDRTSYPIPRAVMSSFLNDVAARFKPFRSTVGHHHAGDLSLATGDLRQFHYYPQRKWWGTSLLPSKLPPQSETGAFIGEFQSHYRQEDQSSSVPWPEIPRAVQAQDGLVRTVARLRLLEAKGYGLAILWPDCTAQNDAGAPIDYEPATSALEPLHYSQPILDGIRQYLKS
jgi:hypothetical protein